MKSYIKSKLSYRLKENTKAIFFDLKRSKTRLFQKKRRTSPKVKKLHLGSGARAVKGWIIVDLVQSDCNSDPTYAEFQDFLKRGDDKHTLYIKAKNKLAVI